jgi:predicted DNA-binding transcriptional regulator YafY
MSHHWMRPMGRKKINTIHDMKHSRIVEILTRLDNGKELSVTALAREFKVSPRAIQRDFVEIEEKYNLETLKKGWKKFAEGEHFKRAELTVEQEAALIMLENFSGALGVESEGAISSLRKALANSPADPITIAPVFPARRRPALRDPLILKALKEAIESGKKLKIRYTSPIYPEPVTRIICPLKLFFTEGFTYVLTLREGTKHSFNLYRIDRVLEHEFVRIQLPEAGTSKYLHMSAKFRFDTFIPPRGIDELIKRSRSVWGIGPASARKLQVRLKITGWAPEYFRNNELVPGQKVTALKDGSLLYEAKVIDLRELRQHILRWLPDIEVLEPAELREDLRACARAFLKK